jgi:IS30 family transposase
LPAANRSVRSRRGSARPIRACIEIARNRKPDGRYQPWFAHNQAYLRRRRPKPRRFAVDARLRAVVAVKLARRWSPAQISRWLRRRHRRRLVWHVCAETIYEAIYRGLVVPVQQRNLRTGRLYRHRRGRGRSRDGALKQSTTMKSIHQRPPAVESRRQAGHWEGDLIIGAGQRSAIATLVERKFRTTMLVPVPETTPLNRSATLSSPRSARCPRGCAER